MAESFAHTPVDALREAVNATACDLSYIGELAGVLSEIAEDNPSPNRLEALARCIALMADNVGNELEAQFQKAAHARSMGSGNGQARD